MQQVQDEKTAFVAMRSGRDRHDDRDDEAYAVISDVLDEAGFTAVRVEDVRASGGSDADTVRRLLEAALVVADMSGDPPDVAYQVGVCHGAGRSRESVILLRGDDAEAPFGPAHFRQSSYRDTDDLRAALRYHLGIVLPLADDRPGHVLAFEFGADASHGAAVSAALRSAMRSMRFSGRCEYYAADVTPNIAPGRHLVGLALRLSVQKTPPRPDWWAKFRALVGEGLVGTGCSLSEDASAPVPVGSIRADLPERGIAEFDNGRVARVILSTEGAAWLTAAGVDED